MVAEKASRYVFRCWLVSSSGPRFKGVHLGSSWNRRIALTYYSQVIIEWESKKEKRKTYVLLISRKAVIDTGGEDNQIILGQLDAHPLILLAADIKVPLSITDVSNLLVLMKMLSEEHLHFGFVGLAHSGGRNDDLIAVLVAAVCCEGIDVCEVW
jgi:hypothetical protein